MADLTLKEVRELVSKEYELNPGAKYLLVFNRNQGITAQSIQSIQNFLYQEGIISIAIEVEDPETALKLLEITDAKPTL